MKTTVTLLVLLMTGTISMAQDGTAHLDKMKIFEGWSGRWEGEGWMQMGPGEARKATVVEQITPKLGGLVYLVEGLGTIPEGTPGAGEKVHEAVALLSWDPASSRYRFRTHVMSGHSSDAWFTVVGQDKFQWGFDIPHYGKMRYTITIDTAKGTWHEIGEISRDGSTWNKTFEMNLKKVN